MEKHLFEEDAVEERTDVVCLVPVDMNRKLLHVDALRQSSACHCTRHKKDNQAPVMKLIHIPRCAVGSGP